MAPSLGKRLKYIAEYGAAMALLSGLRVLPFAMRVKLGGAVVGYIIAHLGKFKTRIRNNLRYIYPDISDTEVARLTKSVGRNFGRTFTEYLNNRDYARHTELFHASGPGLEALEAARRAGQGAIVLSGHFGQWEAMRHYLKSRGIEVGAIYRPTSNMYFDKMYRRNIEIAGQPIFPVGPRGTANMVRHIAGGGVVGILMDQRVEQGETLTFMGKDAMTSDSAAKIALKLGVPLIPCYGTRRGDSLDIDVHFDAPVPHTDARSMTQALNDSLEARVRETPEQWFWLHRRWGILDQA